MTEFVKVAKTGEIAGMAPCGVLATEAFDLAGDPTAFPEQVAGPINRRELFLENLRPPGAQAARPGSARSDEKEYP